MSAVSSLTNYFTSEVVIIWSRSVRPHPCNYREPLIRETRRRRYVDETTRTEPHTSRDFSRDEVDGIRSRGVIQTYQVFDIAVSRPPTDKTRRNRITPDRHGK